MEEIYNLVGKNLEKYQELENNLQLLLYCYYLENEKKGELELKEKVLKRLVKLEDKKEMGKKLEAIKDFRVLEDEKDICVLKYIKDNRNYLAHEFFAENEFNTKEKIEKHKNKLQQMYKDTKLIVDAISKMILKYNDNK